MQIEEYIEQSSRTCANLNNIQENNLHMILGMLTEIGEMADVFKKNLAYNKDIDWINVGEELGDLMWYVANFCRINNLNLNQILDINIEKLKLRYPNNFTKESALNRNLNAERDTLNKINY